MAVEYAKGTSVPTSRTEAEIRKLLAEHGANRLAVMTDLEQRRVEIAFQVDRLAFRMAVPMPDPSDRAFNYTNHRTPRELTKQERDRKLSQAERERWRAVLLLVKAKLQAIQLGVSTWEEEFLPYLVIDRRGQTLGQKVLPNLQAVLETGDLPTLPLLSNE